MMKMTFNEVDKFIQLRNQGFIYNPETGEVSKNGKVYKASKNGWKYFKANIDVNGEEIKMQTYVHRYGFWFMTNKCPVVIDHINRIRYDNRFENLRESTIQENSKNRSKIKGYIEILNKKDEYLYQAYYYKFVGTKKRKFIIGSFNTAEEAAQAYKNSKNKN